MGSAIDKARMWLRLATRRRGCVQCGYDVGTLSVCSECGNPRSESTRWDRYAARYGIWHILAPIVCFAICVAVLIIDHGDYGFPQSSIFITVYWTSAFALAFTIGVLVFIITSSIRHPVFDISCVILPIVAIIGSTQAMMLLPIAIAAIRQLVP